jgi:hypothetical protein
MGICTHGTNHRRSVARERGGHKAVLSDIENGLRDLCSAMVDDIKEAERELAEAKP